MIDREIAPSMPLEAMTRNQVIDMNLGIRPDLSYGVLIPVE